MWGQVFDLALIARNALTSLDQLEVLLLQHNKLTSLIIQVIINHPVTNIVYVKFMLTLFGTMK
jgi:hypothetical protein